MPDVNIAKVAVENTAFHFDDAYSYRIPDALRQRAKPGCRVLVPFGSASKKRQGMILSVERTAAPDRALKPISAVQDEEPVLRAEGIALVYFLHERTFCTLYEAVRAILPSGMGLRGMVQYAALPASAQPSDALLTDDEKAVVRYLLEKGGFVRAQKLLADCGADAGTLDGLCQKGFLFRNDGTTRRMTDLMVKSIRLTDEFLRGDVPCKLTAKQKSVVDVLGDVGSASVREVCYFTGVTPAVPSALVRHGIASFFSVEQYRAPYAGVSVPTDVSPIELTQEQTQAYRNLCVLYERGTGAASLLFGVTGSGKTKVYMKLIDRVLRDGKSVILMVPEIALTPQVLQLFYARYGQKVAVFHSALSVGERLDEWKRVRRGEAQIAVGTRSAVFAPFEDLGLVILDEEQESAYKSESSPRYHARDVARFRCARHHALLLLASATPSVETFAAAEKGRYTLNTLTQRYGDALLPEVVKVDMLRERRSGNKSEISAVLRDALQETLAADRQAILLMNRRGYNTFASCAACGTVLTCPSCSISMTYHKANGRMMCHYCGYSAPLTPVCPSCGEKAVQYSGYGTQKIEDELSRLLPEARILRMDTDTTMTRFAHEEKLRQFADHQYDVLVGTQMVAKGLDFENVTLVGVISADSLLYNDDYRALERTFSLLTQVVGRSGRGRFPGKAIIQTTAPENDVLTMAAQQDYLQFYRTEIGVRRLLVYPPYCDLCVAAFSGEDELLVRGAANAFLELLKAALRAEENRQEKLIVLGPAPARVYRMGGKYRYRLTVKCRNTAHFRAMIAQVLRRAGKDKRFSKVSVIMDVNPENIV